MNDIGRELSKYYIVYGVIEHGDGKAHINTNFIRIRPTSHDRFFHVLFVYNKKKQIFHDYFVYNIRDQV